MPEPVAQRVVPGAPPPAPLSKTQKKKRKAKGKSGDESPVIDSSSAALLEKAPESSEIQEGIVAPELVAQESQAPPLPEEELLFKPSPIVDLIHKRLKATTKKISRISVYAATDSDKLNDDQKRTLKTLPTLEAIQKELGEVKKAVEVHEAELVQELTSKRLEVEKAEKARIANAVSAAETALVSKINDVLDVLRLRSSLATDDSLDISNLADIAENSAIYSTADALLSDDEESKRAAVNGFLFGTGNVGGVTYTRILEIVQLALNPPRAPTPVQEEEVDEQQQPTPEESSVDSEAEAPVAGVPSGTASSSFRFIQESELETLSFEEGVEQIEKADAAGHQEDHIGNGHVSEQPSAAPAPLQLDNSTLNWADDEGGLPSIASLQATYKTSGSATPAEVAEEVLETPVPDANGHANGHAAPQQEEDDGFTQARGGRGRGRGQGQFRGGERGHRGFHRGGRGGPPGGDRGGFRGGDRGNFRGFRGGDRGSYLLRFLVIFSQRLFYRWFPWPWWQR
ncbi:hypothetical protein B0H34DRAFT_697356 [Crassisporium funariophilum]|nr:hypothetical protein B0H34DRAFT_697356 [Crassisporium funariophilum]